ncbi:MAG: sugar transferase, partial [Rhodobacteraceae bacterium]|nr:sugar transferase [Paracoccaceae bacterium]
ATMVMVGATSRGRVFFCQSRVGKDGRRFAMIKFRSMYTDAEERRASLLATSDRDGTTFKMKDDPRITPVGRFIRRASIDELPQLINVLKGDMSLVGPRPALPTEVAEYPVHALERMNVLPGITGIWQISGRADVSFDQMIAMDVAYVRGATIWIDVVILWRTIGAVLTARGAY